MAAEQEPALPPSAEVFSHPTVAGRILEAATKDDPAAYLLRRIIAEGRPATEVLRSLRELRDDGDVIIRRDSRQPQKVRLEVTERGEELYTSGQLPER